MFLQSAAEPMPWDATTPWPVEPLGALTLRIFPGLGGPLRAGGGRRGDGQGPDERLLALADVQEHGLPGRPALAPAPAVAAGRLDRYRVQAGDVVLAARGTRCCAALVSEPTAGAIASASLLVLRCGPALQPAVLLTLLRGPGLISALWQRSRSAPPRLALRAADLATLPIPVPPQPLQQRLTELLLLAAAHHHSAVRAADLRLQATAALAQALLTQPTERPR